MYNLILVISLAFVQPIAQVKELQMAVMPKEFEMPKVYRHRKGQKAYNQPWYAKFF